MDDVFEEFTEFKIDEYIPITDDDVTEVEIKELVKSIGPEHLIDIDGEPVLNPNIKPQPPPFTRQESIGASFVRTLYINPSDIDSPSPTTIQRVTTSINIINNYLSRSDLHWKITFDTIKGKLSKNGNYLGNTLYGIWRLADGANLVMKKSLHKNPDTAGSTTVIIDYCNLKGGLGRCRFPSEPDGDFADEINNWTMDTFGRTDRIIISIQANNIRDTNFVNFKNKLRHIFGPKNIVIIVGSDASSYDDLNIAYIVTKLLPKSNKYIISSDKFIDLHRINADSTTSLIFENKDGPPLLRMITVEKTFCHKRRRRRRDIEEDDDTGPSSSRRPFLHAIRSGGTNKNKKLLINKYSKKNKYTRKVKKLHKKRILIKKVVKKYNKNYKKKTLKRKNK